MLRCEINVFKQRRLLNGNVIIELEIKG
uniref:Uncharacterized protein n=1 Tax=Tetranychus urticae TaxID=32264 RepID=T1KNB9_TETUR